MMLQPNVKALVFLESDKKIFSYRNLCKACDPKDGLFGPRGII